MRSHRGNQHFIGDIHEGVIDGSKQHNWPFDKPRHLVEQRGILTDGEARLFRQHAEVTIDFGAALCRVERNFRIRQTNAVGIKR